MNLLELLFFQKNLGHGTNSKALYLMKRAAFSSSRSAVVSEPLHTCIHWYAWDFTYLHIHVHTSISTNWLVGQTVRPRFFVLFDAKAEEEPQWSTLQQRLKELLAMYALICLHRDSILCQHVNIVLLLYMCITKFGSVNVCVYIFNCPHNIYWHMYMK